MKKIMPYLIFINCINNNKKTDPDINHTYKNRNIKKDQKNKDNIDEFKDFLEENFNQKNIIDEKYFQINIYNDNASVINKNKEKFEIFLEQKKKIKFIFKINYPSTCMRDPIDFYKNFGEIENTYWCIGPGPLQENPLSRKMKPIYQIYLEDIFYLILILKKNYLLYFEADLDKVFDSDKPNSHSYALKEKIKKGTILTFEEFLKKLEDNQIKFKVDKSKIDKGEYDSIIESEIYEKYKNLFEITYK
jgi:hypothetical protein